MNDTVPLEIFDVLKEAVKGDIEDFTITLQDPNKKGEGYLGQMFFVSLKNKRTGKQLNIVVKQAYADKTIRKLFPIRHAFLNEIYFYTTLWPKLLKFQETIPPQYHFVHIAKCFAGVSRENFEGLVLQNLKYDGFVLQKKSEALGRDKYEFIFRIYGKLHATSFAYKELHPEEYSKLSEGMIDVWKTFGGLESFQEALRLAFEKTFESLQPGVDDEVIEKYRHYLSDGTELYRRSLVEGKYNCLTHGDSWSNNMMFKYDNSGKLTDLRLLDFQMARIGSPICDLSYCLYSGGTKEIFDDMDHFLHVYHDSLSENLRAYGCDPDIVYPFEAIQSEWKVHCQLGLAVGMLVWRGKLTYEEDAVDLTDFSDDEKGVQKYFDTKYDVEAFQRITRDIILHAYKNNYLF